MTFTTIKKYLALGSLFSSLCLFSHVTFGADLACAPLMSLPVTTQKNVSYPVRYICTNLSPTQSVTGFSVNANVTPGASFVPDNTASCQTASLAPNQTCVYSGTFTPHTPGAQQIQLTVNYSNKTKTLPTINTTATVLSPRIDRWYLSYGIGAIFYNAPSTSIGHYGFNGAPNYAFADNTIKNDMLVTLEGGYEFRCRYNCWLPADRIGLEYQWLHNTQINGVNYPPDYPAGTRYADSYNFGSQDIFVVDQVDLITWHHISPYLKAGLGLAINTLSNYQEVTLSGSGGRNGSEYQPKTNVNFAYLLGAGVSYAINYQFVVSLGYDYNNLGSASFNPSPNFSNVGPTYSNITANDVTLSARYLFGGWI